MSIEITGRHVEISESMRDNAQRRLDKRAAEFPRIDKVHVILDVQKFMQIAEVVVHAARHIQLEAKSTSENMYASTDEGIDKADTRARKTIDKRHEHKGQGKLRDLEALPDPEKG